MPYWTTLGIVAGLSVAGATAGLALGHATVGDIDPSYRQNPEVTFHGDLAANRGPDWAQVQAREYAASAEPVITQCDGCTRPYPVEYFPSHDAAVDGQPVRAAVRQTRVVRVEAEETPQVVYVEAPDRARVVRYASYPVSQEEAAAQQAEAASADQADYAATQ